MATTAARLTDADVARFRAEGYLLPGVPLFAADKLDALEAIFNEHLEAKGDKLSDELDTPHFRDPRLLEYLLSDEVLDLVEPLIGPDIALWTSVQDRHLPERVQVRADSQQYRGDRS